MTQEEGTFMKIGIIGAGHIGGSLGELWAARGHDVIYGVRAGSEAPGQKTDIRGAANDAEVVVLAVPGSAAQESIEACGDLSGRVVIDCTNFSGDGQKSGAERIAGWARG